MNNDFDVVIVGSGFGGSVAALRLVEKGYRVAVLEAGRRFSDADFPKTSWRLRKFLFMPRLGLIGLQRIHYLPDAIVLAGAGVGGGSLIYANTLYQPGDKYFQDPLWSHITDWKGELTPFYDLARRMLGVSTNPYFSPSDQAMKDTAIELGVGDTFQMAPLGIFFGDGTDATVADPYFGGAGPHRNGCIQCGACMTGCRNNAKNTLPKNYLGLAERAGARIFPLTTVTSIEQDSTRRWIISTSRTGPRPQAGETFSADEVIIAAGTFNTQKLLHRMKSDKKLTKLSDSLGDYSRTNSESLVGAIMPTTKIDFSKGSAITSSFFPNEYTHIEPVRYGKGSNFMGLLQTIMTNGSSSKARRKQWLEKVRKEPALLAKILNVRKWSQRTVIALVMQSVDSWIRVRPKRSLFGWHLTSKNSTDHPNATWIPIANQTAKLIAEKYQGIAAGHLGDLINAPFTAHFVGGAIISDSPQHGVVDPYHRVWNYPTMHIVDGSTLTANLGVNPSLTITAQAERAFSLWPNKGEIDLRPKQGEPYTRIEPISPHQPVVPKGAPGELRFAPPSK